jgi:hypothetical protein
MTNSLLIILCAHRMKLFFLIGKVEEFLFCGVMLVLTLSLYRARVSNEMLKSYSWRVKVQLALPFNRRWSREVAPEDVEPIRRYRRALFTIEITLLAFGLWTVFYDTMLGTRLLMMMAHHQCGQ